MTKKSKKLNFNFIKQIFPYLLASALLITTVFYGSMDKFAIKNSELSIQNISTSDYAVPADQVSHFYMVSELANSMRLATAEAVNLNYNSLTVLKSIGQASTEKLEKPEIVDISHLSRGIIAHTVSEGETLASISAQYGLTETQARWSNNLKTSTISVGQVLYLPSTPGIVYKVKSGDTISSLSSKYKSDPESIITINDLENSTELAVDSSIILPSGELPETERPEYVRPIVQSNSRQVYYRTYWTSANPMPWGWCTWYTWQRRSELGSNYTLPGGLGNANTWDNSLYGRYRIDYNPEPGAIFQTDRGYYGHVGIVDSVNADGTITISDMNGISGWGSVGRKTITKSEWSTYKYIHERL